jgi:hypothetical protein
MKLVFPRNTDKKAQELANLKLAAPPIPLSRYLEESQLEDDKKGEHVKMPLKYNPTDPNTSTYEIKIKVFHEGDPYEWIRFLETLDQIFEGQNITQAQSKFAMIPTLMKGSALRTFTNKKAELRGNSNADFTECLHAVANKVFPKNALKKQKRYLRRLIFKTLSNSTRETANAVVESSSHLRYFPPNFYET